MAITFADAASIVEDRLHNKGDSASTPPTNAMIQTDLRDAARHLISTLRPVFLTSGTLASGLTATISSKSMILHVEVNNDALLPSEWRETTGGVIVVDYRSAKTSDTVYVWYVKQIAIASDDASVDVDCIHGADWIYSPMLVYAEMQSELRLSNVGDANNAMIHLQRYRTLENDYNQKVGQLQQARENDLAMIFQRTNARAQFGRGVWREGALAGFETDVQTANFTTGQE